jgi:hypothetical protein
MKLQLVAATARSQCQRQPALSYLRHYAAYRPLPGASSYNGLNLYFEHRPDKTLPEGKTQERLISQRSGSPIATVFEECLVSETVH